MAHDPQSQQSIVTPGATIGAMVGVGNGGDASGLSGANNGFNGSHASGFNGASGFHFGGNTLPLAHGPSAQPQAGHGQAPAPAVAAAAGQASQQAPQARAPAAVSGAPAAGSNAGVPTISVQSQGPKPGEQAGDVSMPCANALLRSILGSFGGAERDQLRRAQVQLDALWASHHAMALDSPPTKSDDSPNTDGNGNMVIDSINGRGAPKPMDVDSGKK